MSSKPFRFKQFTIHHDRSTMKVGTDGVVLGAWVNVGEAKRILDIGTGSGLIALMLAQRSSPHARIDAVEIEKNNADQANENVQNSPWPAKVIIYHTAVQDFQSDKKYDCIVSNPPYFQNSLKPPDEKRGQARHTSSLSYEELLSTSLRLLAPSGKVSIILPNPEGLQFIELARQAKLVCTRKWSVRSRQEKPGERWLLEFSKQETRIEERELVLYTGEEWTTQYTALTQAYYDRDSR